MRKQAGNTDKQGGNILIQTIYGDWKVMGKKKDIRAAMENAGMAGGIKPEDLVKMKGLSRFCPIMIIS